MSKNPLVSVIMPAFNAEKYIEEAIRSVLDQDYPNFELLVINDGSTDDTKQIAEAFDDKRIRYFEQENKGVSAARNMGLDNMQGIFFCFLDADDLFTQISLTSRINIFKQNPELDFVDGVIMPFNKNGELSKQLYKPSFRGYPQPKLLQMSSDCFFGQSWLIRNDNCNSYSFEIDMEYCEDLFFYISISEGKLYDFTDVTILMHREHIESVMRNMAGLEFGYRVFLKKIKNGFSNDSVVFRAKTRIIRIMFLSWLRVGKNPLRALLSTFRILLI